LALVTFIMGEIGGGSILGEIFEDSEAEYLLAMLAK